jgi:hypothetical protein
MSTEHMLSIWDLRFANGHNTKQLRACLPGSVLFAQKSGETPDTFSKTPTSQPNGTNLGNPF